MRIQVELLENHGRGASYQRNAVFLGQFHVVDENLTGGGHFKAVHAAHGGGLSGPGRSYDDELFPFMHIEIDALEHFMVTEGFMNIGEPDHVFLPHGDVSHAPDCILLFCLEFSCQN